MYFYMTDQADETVTVYDLELDEDLFDNLQEKIEPLDPSTNYGKKHTVEQACKVANFLLEEKHKEWDGDVNQIKREMSEIEKVLQ